MKPRIIKLQGIWHCGVRGIPNKRIGVGYSPKAAYLDWLGEGHDWSKSKGACIEHQLAVGLGLEIMEAGAC